MSIQSFIYFSILLLLCSFRLLLYQWAGSAIPTVVSTTASTPVSYMQTAAPAATQSVVSGKCNWTEHTSPDGFKYYYNGQTGESKVRNLVPL